MALSKNRAANERIVVGFMDELKEQAMALRQREPMQVDERKEAVFEERRATNTNDELKTNAHVQQGVQVAALGHPTLHHSSSIGSGSRNQRRIPNPTGDPNATTSGNASARALAGPSGETQIASGTPPNGQSQSEEHPTVAKMFAGYKSMSKEELVDLIRNLKRMLSQVLINNDWMTEKIKSLQDRTDALERGVGLAPQTIYPHANANANANPNPTPNPAECRWSDCMPPPQQPQGQLQPAAWHVAHPQGGDARHVIQNAAVLLTTSVPAAVATLPVATLHSTGTSPPNLGYYAPYQKEEVPVDVLMRGPLYSGARFESYKAQVQAQAQAQRVMLVQTQSRPQRRQASFDDDDDPNTFTPVHPVRVTQLVAPSQTTALLPLLPLRPLPLPFPRQHVGAIDGTIPNFSETRMETQVLPSAKPRTGSGNGNGNGNGSGNVRTSKKRTSKAKSRGKATKNRSSGEGKNTGDVKLRRSQRIAEQKEKKNENTTS